MDSALFLDALRAAAIPNDDPDSFTARINRDSQLLARLNNSTELELEDDLLESTFQTAVNDESTKHTSQDQDDLSDLLIEIEFPIGSINVLNSYFGDDDIVECNDSQLTKVIKLPYKLAEALHAAMHPSTETKDDDESFALALAQQFEEEEMAETEKCVRQSDNSEKVRQMESLFQHKPKLLASADNPTPEIPVLKTLYDLFPQLSKNCVKQAAQACKYDVDTTSKELRKGLKRISLEKMNETKSEDLSYIVPSAEPTVINEKKKSEELFPKSEYIDENGKDVYNQDTIREYDSLIDRCENYAQMNREFSRANRDPTIIGHYSSIARSAAEFKNDLIYERDRIHVIVQKDSDSIDLHGYNLERATNAVLNKINFCREHAPNMRKLTIITGKGSSTGGKAILRERVLKIIHKNKIGGGIIVGNEGAVRIRMNTVTQPVKFE